MRNQPPLEVSRQLGQDNVIRWRALDGQETAYWQSAAALQVELNIIG